MTIQDMLYQKKDYIEKELAQGRSINNLSIELKCNPGNVWVFVKENRINVLSPKRSKIYNQEHLYKDEIIAKFESGLSACRIANDMDISKHTVLRWLNKWGFDTSGKRTGDPNNLLKDKLELVVGMFKDGNSCIKIGEVLGHSSSQISILLNKHGYKLKHGIYDVDEHFFEVIDTEEKAYILGWFYSDGNVMPNGLIRISILERDGAILHKIKDILKYTGPLHHKKPKNERCQPQIELSIGKKCLSDQLIKLGCVPNKSLILKFPTNEQVPEHLLRHFIRGYIDGDGSIQERNITITGSYDFIYGLKDKLPCGITGIYQRNKGRDPHKGAHTLHVARRPERLILLHYLYDNSTIYLDRKYQKAKDLLNA